MTLQGFPPAVDGQSRILVLGSMPGEESLRKQQYYGHPRNHFWPILYTVFGGQPGRSETGAGDVPYEERLAFALRHGIALWDVLRTCRRKGSLDSEIREPDANDFEAFFAAYPAIGKVLFNGKTAAKLFARLVPAGAMPKGLIQVELPSTSPAMTAPFQQKLQVWQEALLGPGVREV